MYKQIISILINPSQFTADKRRGTFPWVKSSHLDVGPDAEHFVYLREQEYFDELNIFLQCIFRAYCLFKIFLLWYAEHIVFLRYSHYGGVRNPTRGVIIPITICGGRSKYEAKANIYSGFVCSFVFVFVKRNTSIDSDLWRVRGVNMRGNHICTWVEVKDKK